MTNFNNAPWGPPPTELVLSGTAVHVWRAPLDQPPSLVEQLSRSLSIDELKRAERFYFQKDRAGYLTSRGALRDIIGRYLGIEPSEIRFRYNPYGKPSIDEPVSGERIGFNLSKSGGTALYAVTLDRAIGVDIERIRDGVNHMETASRFFGPGENRALHKFPAAERYAAFFACWTRKEAYVKAKGEGLSLPLDQFEVSIGPEEPVGLVSVGGDVQEARHWSMRELIRDSEYVAALAVEGPIGDLACWQYAAPAAESKVRGVTAQPWRPQATSGG